jgi:hypothetical protein
VKKLTRTVYYQDKREYSVNVGAPAGKVVITDASHPTSTDVNKECPWYVVGHVENAPVTNPGVGYLYKDGPADKIIIVNKDGSEDTLSKGYCLAIYYKATKDPCTNIDSRALERGVKFPAAGTYTIWLISGYVSADEAALGTLTPEELYKLQTSHFKALSAAPVTIKTTAAGIVPAVAPIALGTLALLLVK